MASTAKPSQFRYLLGAAGRFNCPKCDRHQREKIRKLSGQCCIEGFLNQTN